MKYKPAFARGEPDGQWGGASRRDGRTFVCLLSRWM